MNALIFSLSSSQQWGKIRLHGPDARDFLHRITTARARAMDPGQGTWASILTAQGKIRGHFVLWCEEENSFSLEFTPLADQSHQRKLLEAIDQFTFAEKMTLETSLSTTEAVPHWIRFDSEEAFAQTWTELMGSSVTPPRPSERYFTRLPDQKGMLYHHGTQDFGVRWISLWAPAPLAGSKPWSSEFEKEFHGLRVQTLRPWVGSEISDEVNPLEIGSPDAVAENKGCYPGQEVIEKIAAIGSPAKRLIRVQGLTGEPSPGEKLFQGETEVGTLTTVSREKNQWHALALARKSVIAEGTSLKSASGAPCTTHGVAPYLSEEILK